MRSGCQASLEWKAETAAAGTHLALLGSQKQDDGTLGFRRAPERGLFVYPDIRMFVYHEFSEKAEKTMDRIEGRKSGRKSRLLCRLLCLTVCLSLCLAGCGYADRISGGGVDSVQEKALENALARLSDIPGAEHVNTKYVQARYLSGEEEPAVVLFSGEDAEAFFARTQDRFWVFLIGNAAGYEYVQVVCSSVTDEAVGYIEPE